MVTVPPLPESLVGRTVGFFDSRKANFDRLADEIGGSLRAEHGVKAVIHRRKANPSTPASAVVPNCTFSRAVSRPIQPI
jgi:hypothetical protein